MDRSGTVLTATDGWATVRILNARCADCPGICAVGKARLMTLQDPEQRLSAGDRVTISVSSRSLLRHAGWVYGVALLCILTAAVLGDAIAGNRGTVVSVVVALAASMWMIGTRLPKESPKWKIESLSGS